MTLASGVALVVFLFPLAYSPGPGNAFFAAIGASRGLRAAIPALAGYHVATFVITCSIGLGMGATVLRHPAVAKALAAIGAVYVLWLAWLFFRSARSRHASSIEIPARSVGFWSGAVVLLLNPKAYYIIAVMFARFLQPPQDGDLLAVLAITVIFTLNNLLAFVIWTLAGQGLSALFRGVRSKKWLDYGFAVTLVGVAVWMALPVFL
ncbi:LysE family translocator [Microbacterium sp. p3-SID336]|uniref:LysE family translocator n=1 Tax=Microbacterium sp. p3-SID336 TaxID=2916212 RepID=UPI0021A58A54|nr:LysE family translocator [Microbacterium sp. p3-SID336]MCT1479098.1 LysE family translocator [Microbacterium sp. p3-SID336]